MSQTIVSLRGGLRVATQIQHGKCCVGVEVDLTIGVDETSPSPTGDGRGLKPFVVDASDHGSSPTSGPGMRIPPGSAREDE